MDQLEPASGASEAAVCTVRLLVVDPDPRAMLPLAEWLTANPEVEVECCGTAEETLTGIAGKRFDLCLIDEGRGDLDGVTLGAMILQISPTSRIVLMTGRVTTPLRQRALEHGFRGVLAKPVVPAVLSMLVEPMRA